MLLLLLWYYAMSCKKVDKVSSIEELGFNHKEQIDLISGCQDSLLKAQSTDLYDDIDSCPKCQSKLKWLHSSCCGYRSHARQGL